MPAVALGRGKAVEATEIAPREEEAAARKESRQESVLDLVRSVIAPRGPQPTLEQGPQKPHVAPAAPAWQEATKPQSDLVPARAEVQVEGKDGAPIRLVVSTAGKRVRVSARLDSADEMKDMSERVEELRGALKAHGLELRGMDVQANRDHGPFQPQVPLGTPGEATSFGHRESQPDHRQPAEHFGSGESQGATSEHPKNVSGNERQAVPPANSGRGGRVNMIA
ncbi:MAG: hypothetical protein HY698_11630 [Deltaproteobacteria bacterium]|nr:hypothetical protein [Deltaproteobacteria bacterium]